MWKNIECIYAQYMCINNICVSIMYVECDHTYSYHTRHILHVSLIHIHYASIYITRIIHTHFFFFDGYCSTVQGLLDWFEVDSGFTIYMYIYMYIYVCIYISHVSFTHITHPHVPYISLIHIHYTSTHIPYILDTHILRTTLHVPLHIYH